MKKPTLLSCLALLLAAPLPAGDSDARKANTVVLDATGVKNLRIQTAIAEPAVFEETILALGRIEVYPGRRAVISSRIEGRALEVFVKHDHVIAKGDIAVVIESRQFGDPPPKVNLTAPISGVVSAAHVVPGEPVNPDKVLAEILDLSEVYALARVPEHLAGRLQSGQKARIAVAAVSGEIFYADLEHLGATADPESGTIEAAFHVENASLKLRPGMRAEFAIITAERKDVTSVPRSALQGDPASRYVFVKDFDLPNAFVKVPVVVGQTNDQVVEIISGLFPADEVVIQGAYSLAFAGSGSVSLKEALDAAHGHAHNPDGSEKTAGQKQSAASPSTEEQEHVHSHVHQSPFWMIVSIVLFVLLLVVSFTKKRRDHAAKEA